MLITKIEPINKKRCKIYIDYELAFALYNNEISLYNLSEDSEIEELLYDDIIDKIIYPGAKQYAMSIIERSSKTESELRRKLKYKYYPDNIIDRVILLLKEYRYIDDEMYTDNFIDYKKHSKSKRQLYQELIYKGVEKDIIDSSMEELYDTSYERELLYKQIKKHLDKEGIIPEDKIEKITINLYRKGFKLSDIQDIISEINQNK